MEQTHQTPTNDFLIAYGLMDSSTFSKSSTSTSTSASTSKKTSFDDIVLDYDENLVLGQFGIRQTRIGEPNAALGAFKNSNTAFKTKHVDHMQPTKTSSANDLTTNGLKIQNNYKNKNKKTVSQAQLQL